MLFLQPCEYLSSPTKVVCARCTFSSGWLAQGMAHLHECFLMSSGYLILCYIAEFGHESHLNAVENHRMLLRALLLPNMTCNWHLLGHPMHSCVVQLQRACLLRQWGRYVMLWHCEWSVFVFLNAEKNGKKRILCTICFLTIFFLCICICWTCLISQDGATPLYISAQNGHKDVVEILLRNGAEVNAAKKVIPNEWTDLI